MAAFSTEQRVVKQGKKSEKSKARNVKIYPHLILGPGIVLEYLSEEFRVDIQWQ